MTITIEAHWIPWTITGIVIAVFMFWPTKGPSGSYDFTPGLMAAFRFFVSIIVILVTWLIYFAAT